MVTDYVLTYRFLFMLSEKGTEPVILVARTTHYTPTLLLCFFTTFSIPRLCSGLAWWRPTAAETCPLLFNIFIIWWLILLCLRL